jgi:sugar/nucleoside kinase (ribokinase family)
MLEVGCAGILVKDTFCGPMASLPPEGSLLALDDMPVRAGGCAANVALDLAKQGVAVDLAGCLGNDSAADFLLDIYKKSLVGCSRVLRMEGYSTSRCIILLVEGEDRRYLYVDGANRAFTVRHLAREWLAQLKVFYLGGLFALPGFEVESLAQVLRFCRESKVTTVVDVVVPQGFTGMASLKPLLPFIDMFVPNEDEARAFTGLTDPVDQLRAFRAAGANTVIVTRGAHGVLAGRAEKQWRCGSYQMNVVDPSGSGDAFTSGIIRSLLLGWDMPQMLCYASAVGASVTRAAGTTDTMFSAAEAETFVREQPLIVTEVH